MLDEFLGGVGEERNVSIGCAGEKRLAFWTAADEV